MAIDDRRDAATMTHRRNFLIGIASLITAPAVVRAESLMPIRVWRPRGYFSRNAGIGQFIGFRTGDLLGVDLDMPTGTFDGSPGQTFIHLNRQNAGLVAAATNRRIVVLGPVALQEVQRLVKTPPPLPPPVRSDLPSFA
jgi:hypothetical protein